MINFPDNAVLRQKFITSNGLMYFYDGIKWNIVRSEVQLLPDHTVNEGKYLSSDGSDFIWDDIPEDEN